MNYCDTIELKKKVICDFLDYLFNLEKGRKKDYELILLQVSLIELIESGNICLKDAYFYAQYYLNNKWEITTF